MKDTVVRAGYGINYANGQYAKFIQDFAFQPPYANVQTNEATTGAPLTLAHGFLPSGQTEGNYAVNKNYRLPYVQVWNINLQRTLPLGIVLNFGYNGSKGTRLDIVNAPGRSPTASLSGVFYDYEDSVAFSNYNALTMSARKRLQRGIALEAPTPTATPSIMPAPLEAAEVRGRWWRKTGRTCWPKSQIQASTYAINSTATFFTSFPSARMSAG